MISVSFKIIPATDNGINATATRTPPPITLQPHYVSSAPPS
jgi:hypothetical protein